MMNAQTVAGRRGSDTWTGFGQLQLRSANGRGSSPFDGCDSRDTGIDESNAPTPSTRSRPQPPFSAAHAAPNSAGVKASYPLTGPVPSGMTCGNVVGIL